MKCDLKSAGPKRHEAGEETQGSAGFQPAVSPISNRQPLRNASSGRPAGWKPAIQQVGNLRYDVLDEPLIFAGVSDKGQSVARSGGRFIEFFAVLTLVCLLTGCGQKQNAVVAYCAQDKVYTIPLFAQFERETGIEVLPVYDNEAVKTVGLVQRLLAEHANPRCDVFWGNEEMRTRQLEAANILRETNGMATFGYRTRRMVINTNLLSFDAAPRSLLELTNETWRGKVALAYPQFGTTSTHFHALRQLWGPELWLSWLRGLAANEPLVVDGNSVVVRIVGRGDAILGLTDSDDIAVGQREDFPVAALPVNQETLYIPNTAAVIRGAPYPEAAQRLFEFLQSPAVTQALVEANALEGANLQEAKRQGLNVRWDELLENADKMTEQLNEVFLR